MIVLSKRSYSGGPRCRNVASQSQDYRYRLFVLLLTAAFAHFLVSGRLVVYGDAVNIVGIACYIAVALLFYHMFKPVNRNLSLVAALFSLVGCAITALSVVHLVPSHVSPLLFFGPYCVLIGYFISRRRFCLGFWAC